MLKFCSNAKILSGTNKHVNLHNISQIHDLITKSNRALFDRILPNVEHVIKHTTTNTSFELSQITWTNAHIQGVGDKQVLYMFGMLVDEFHPNPIPISTYIPMNLVHFGSEQLINEYFTLMNTSASSTKGAVH